MDIGFTNRIEEIKKLEKLFASDVAKIIIDAPIGFGRTYFLRKAAEIFEAVVRKKYGVDQNNQELVSWNSAYIDLDAKDYQDADALNSIQNNIARQITRNETIFVSSFGALKSAILKEHDQLLIVFDSVERANVKTQNDVKGFVNDLCSLPGNRIKVLITEGYGDNRRGWSAPNRVELLPFMANSVTEMLKDVAIKTKRRYEFKENQYEEWAKKIIKLGGGHPRAIAKLIVDLVGNGFSTDYELYEEVRDLHGRHVATEIEKILYGIEGHTKECLKIISVFRVFTLGTITHLKLKEEIASDKDEYLIFKQMIATGLVNLEKSGYSHGVIRNLILTEMLASSQLRYIRLNEIAIGYYEGLIKETVRLAKEAVKPESLDVIDPTTKIPRYLQECIYHMSQTQLDNQSIAGRLRLLSTRFEQIEAITYQDCREEIERIFEIDQEIATEFGKERINAIQELLYDDCNKPSSTTLASDYQKEDGYLPTVDSLKYSSSPLPPRPSDNAVELFFSYSHEDEDLRIKLEKHLTLLKRDRVIENWHDRKIGAGSEWEREISQHLDRAQIILLLVSSDFLASDYCYDVEVKRALERHESGDATVIPVILRPVMWESALFGKLQALPSNAKPVTIWDDIDEAFLNVAEGIKNAILNRTDWNR